MAAFHHGLVHRWPLHLGVATCCTAIGLAVLLAHRPDALAGPDAAAAAGTWLHVPAFLLTAFTLHAAFEDWPLWGRDRDGAMLLVRLPSAQRALLAAAAGMVLRLVLLLAAIGLVFGLVLPALGAPGQAHAHVYFQHRGAPLLTAARPQVVLVGPAMPLAAIRLRATAFAAPDSDHGPVALQLVADGEPLGDPIVVRGSRELSEVRFTPRRIGTLGVARSSVHGTTILLEEDAVEGVAAQGVPTWRNGALAAVTYAGAGAFVLLLLAPLHSVLALPLLHLTAFLLLLLASITGWLPHGDSVAAFSRSRWLLAEPLTGRWLACLLSAMALCAVTLRLSVRRSL